MKRNLLLFIFILSCRMIVGQSENDTIRLRYNEALNYFQGFYKPYFPARAFILMKGLAEEGFPEAMNAVAIMYSQGIGVDTSYQDAYSWFEKAAASGYYKAFFNLGLLWKYGYGVEKNETKAFECCLTGAGYGDPDCKYAVGYMYYKGLACKQNYITALEYFFDAAADGNMAASYMIGICYRNGYGIQRNEKEARSWLEKSSSGGNFRAKRELVSVGPEDYSISGTLSSEILAQNKIPETYTQVGHNIQDRDKAGRFSGFLVTYDWSGEFIIGLFSLTLDLQVNGHNIKGLWIESDTNIVEINGTITDTALVFFDAKSNRTDHYHRNPIQFFFKSANLNISEVDSVTWLCGNIRFFSEMTMEPERPMYISLNRTNINPKPEIPDSQEKLIDNLRAFPNPFRDYLSISFNLKKESVVKIMVYTIDGRKVYQAEPGKLLTGINIQNMQLDVPEGVYIVKVNCGSESAAAIILKKL